MGLAAAPFSGHNSSEAQELALVRVLQAVGLASSARRSLQLRSRRGCRQTEWSGAAAGAAAVTGSDGREEAVVSVRWQLKPRRKHPAYFIRYLSQYPPGLLTSRSAHRIPYLGRQSLTLLSSVAIKYVGAQFINLGKVS
ncbi:hypothetical protein NDU88_002789 [Pleurodeles waltl]|uniref:Uncharacterized protein n=1 Tax=Pleurodeles waltl TaxID=8319 RepID=A0AAV7TNM0_PLEWA|nr:hypothetical protein NDU88_002789 [Pleurodeles waltl]